MSDVLFDCLRSLYQERCSLVGRTPYVQKLSSDVTLGDWEFIMPQLLHIIRLNVLESPHTNISDLEQLVIHRCRSSLDLTVKAVWLLHGHEDDLSTSPPACERITNLVDVLESAFVNFHPNQQQQVQQSSAAQPSESAESGAAVRRRPRRVVQRSLVQSPFEPPIEYPPEDTQEFHILKYQRTEVLNRNLQFPLLLSRISQALIRSTDRIQSLRTMLRKIECLGVLKESVVSFVSPPKKIVSDLKFFVSSSSVHLTTFAPCLTLLDSLPNEYVHRTRHLIMSKHRLLNFVIDDCVCLNSRDKVPFLIFLVAESLTEEDPQQRQQKDEQKAVSRSASMSRIAENQRQSLEESIDEELANLCSADLSEEQEQLLQQQLDESSSWVYPSGEDSFGFGESWLFRNQRHAAALAKHSRHFLCSIIFKSMDDLSQEQLACQLVRLCQSIFHDAAIPCRLQSYSVISCSRSCGFIETLLDCVSIDSLKKSTGCSLSQFFQQYFTSSESSISLSQALQNFMESLAAYSLVTYILSVKDRHNGNILLCRDGSIIHIDFGFMLSSSPGGGIGFESAPFKLTPEYLELLGGEEGPLFDMFQALFVRGLLELRAHAWKLLLLIDIMAESTTMTCMQAGKQQVLDGVRDRLFLHLNDEQCIESCMSLIDDACCHWRSIQYDRYQRTTNNIL